MMLSLGLKKVFYIKETISSSNQANQNRTAVILFGILITIVSWIQITSNYDFPNTNYNDQFWTNE